MSSKVMVVKKVATSLILNKTPAVLPHLDSQTTLVMVRSHCSMSWLTEGLGSHHVYQELGAHTSRWQVVAASLPNAHVAQPGLVLDDAVEHPHLTAECGQEHHKQRDPWKLKH